jgi:hypothetical protein
LENGKENLSYYITRKRVSLLSSLFSLTNNPVMTKISIFKPPSHKPVPYQPENPFSLDDVPTVSGVSVEETYPDYSVRTRPISKRKISAADPRWLDEDNQDPYVELEKNLLRNIKPIHLGRTWIKYENIATGRHFSGVVLSRCEFPTRIILSNPYTKRKVYVELQESRIYV